MKIACYTCALNEEAFAERWYAAAKDADKLLVLDTGSTDKTLPVLEKLGVTVCSASIKPWRFDDAKNMALNLLPSDIDVAVQVDMDEVMIPDWRHNIEKVWGPETNRLRYKYIWSWMPDGRPNHIYFADKIGGRHTHRWCNPVHEVLKPTVPEVVDVCPEVLIEHHPDKAKSRIQYLDLLELSVKEDPLNDRNSHYLGREYFFHGNYAEAVTEFRRHLSLPTARWPAERASSLRYGAKCLEALQNPEAAYNWYTLAMLEDRQSREALLDLAAYLLRCKEWQGVIYYAMKALDIPPEQSSYINERYALQEGPYDLASVAFHYMGAKQSAIQCARAALNLNPTDERLRTNLLLVGGADAVS